MPKFSIRYAYSHFCGHGTNLIT